MNTLLVLLMLAVSITSSITTRIYLNMKRKKNYGKPLGYTYLKQAIAACRCQAIPEDVSSVDKKTLDEAITDCNFLGMAAGGRGYQVAAELINFIEDQKETIDKQLSTIFAYADKYTQLTDKNIELLNKHSRCDLPERPWIGKSKPKEGSYVCNVCDVVLNESGFSSSYNCPVCRVGNMIYKSGFKMGSEG